MCVCAWRQHPLRHSLSHAFFLTQPHSQLVAPRLSLGRTRDCLEQPGQRLFCDASSARCETTSWRRSGRADRGHSSAKMFWDLPVPNVSLMKSLQYPTRAIWRQTGARCVCHTHVIPLFVVSFLTLCTVPQLRRCTLLIHSEGDAHVSCNCVCV